MEPKCFLSSLFTATRFHIHSLVLCRNLILGLCATGSASASPNDVSFCKALAETVLSEFLAVTKH